MICLDEFASLRNDAANIVFVVGLPKDRHRNARAALMNSRDRLGQSQLLEREPDHCRMERFAGGANIFYRSDMRHGIDAGEEFGKALESLARSLDHYPFGHSGFLDNASDVFDRSILMVDVDAHALLLAPQERFPQSRYLLSAAGIEFADLRKC